MSPRFFFEISVLIKSRDDVANRTLPWYTLMSDNNTAANCLGMCHDFGYMSGAMEWGQECCMYQILPDA